MVKANEIRVGNWVEAGGEIYQATPYTSIIIQREEKIINGIPITEDWLIKFGFFKIADLNNSYVSPNEEFGYTIIGNDKGGWFMMFFNTIKIEYVHQIQNIYFAITGQELKLNQLSNDN